MKIGAGSRGKKSARSEELANRRQSNGEGLRTIGGGYMERPEYGDERPLKTSTGILATTDIEMTWESRSTYDR